jgi:predicted metal-dependent HD superfamily phosphohydrolase
MPNQNELQWLKSIWQEAFQALGAKADPKTGLDFDSIIKRYSEPRRKYHNCDHLLHCLVLLQSCRFLVTNDETYYRLVLAVFFHDAFYDPQYSQNEEVSAIIAEKSLKDAGLPDNIISRISNFILATKHSEMSSDFDTQLMCDLDLAALGLPAQEFDSNLIKIRNEYSMYSKEQFIAGRSKFIEDFLDRPSIYQTWYFRDRFEKIAWENMVVSLAWLPQYPFNP